MTWRGVVSGSLALIALEVIVSSNAAAGRFGKLLEAIGGLITSALSPAKAAIPDLSGAAQANAAGGSGSSSGGFSGGGGGGGGGGRSW